MHRRYAPYAAKPASIRAHVDVCATDPSSHVVWLDGAQQSADLTMRTAAGETILCIPGVEIPTAFTSPSLPAGQSVVVTARQQGRARQHVVTFVTATLEERAERYLQLGATALFVSHAAAAIRRPGHAAMVGASWSSVRRAAHLLSVPLDTRLFYLRYVCTGLYQQWGDVGSGLANNTMGVVCEEGAAALPPGVFDLPIEHSSALAMARGAIISLPANLSREMFVLRMTNELEAMLDFRQSLVVGVVLTSPVTTATLGNGVTVEVMLRFAQCVLERNFVLIDGEWWFLANGAGAGLPPANRASEMRALAVATVVLLMHTGAGPGRFAPPVVCAMAGVHPPAPSSGALPPSVQAVVGEIEAATDQDLAEMHLPAALSGAGWSVDVGGRLCAENKNTLLRAVRAHFWDRVVHSEYLAGTLHDALYCLLGQYAINGVTVHELGELLAGPDLRLDLWREFTGVRDTDRATHDEVVDALFSALVDMDPKDLVRVARFWTGEPRHPRRENGQAHGCWVQVVAGNGLPVAHTCTNTLELGIDRLRAGPAALRDALFESIRCSTDERNELVYSGD